MSDDEDVVLATQRLLEALLADFADEDDDQVVPLGRLLGDLADEIGYEWSGDREVEMTVGQIRRRTRGALARLADGEVP